MLEYLVSPRKARREPWDFFFMALIFVASAVGVTLLVPGLDGGVVVFAMVPAIPLFWSFLVWDERQEVEKIKDAHDIGKRFYHHHRPLVEAFAYFFLGAVIAYTFFAATLPAENAARAFGTQYDEIGRIQAVATGRAFSPARFELLAVNNVKVLGLMFLFCLLYGVGSIYLLLWNASVIGVFVGSKVALSGIGGGATGLLGLVPHGSLEILAYLLASVAGGIFSVAVMRMHWQKPEFKYIAFDVAVLTLASVVLLVVGAAVEASY